MLRSVQSVIDGLYQKSLTGMEPNQLSRLRVSGAAEATGGRESARVELSAHHKVLHKMPGPLERL